MMRVGDDKPKYEVALYRYAHRHADGILHVLFYRYKFSV